MGKKHFFAGKLLLSISRTILVIVSLGYVLVVSACSRTEMQPVSTLIQPSLSISPKLPLETSAIRPTMVMTGEVINLYEEAFDLLLDREVMGRRTDIVRVETGDETVTLNTDGSPFTLSFVPTGVNVQVLGHQAELTETQIVADQIRLLQPLVFGHGGPDMQPMYDFAAQVRSIDFINHLIVIEPHEDLYVPDSWIYTITMTPPPNGTNISFAPDPYWEKSGLPANVTDIAEGSWIQVMGFGPQNGVLQASSLYLLAGSPNFLLSSVITVMVPFTGTADLVGVDGTPTFTLDGRGRKPGDLALIVTLSEDCILTNMVGEPITLDEIHKGDIVAVLEGEGDPYNFIARRVQVMSH